MGVGGRSPGAGGSKIHQIGMMMIMEAQKEEKYNTFVRRLYCPRVSRDASSVRNLLQHLPGGSTTVISCGVRRGEFVDITPKVGLVSIGCFGVIRRITLG